MSVKETIEDKINKFYSWWNSFISVKMNRSIVMILAISWLLFTTFVAGDVPILILVPTILIVAASLSYTKSWSPKVALIAISIYVISSYVTLIILVIVICYLTYIILRERRIKRLKKYAKAKPSELAGLKPKKEEPEIIIHIRE